MLRYDLWACRSLASSERVTSNYPSLPDPNLMVPEADQAGRYIFSPRSQPILQSRHLCLSVSSVACVWRGVVLTSANRPELHIHSSQYLIKISSSPTSLLERRASGCTAQLPLSRCFLLQPSGPKTSKAKRNNKQIPDLLESGWVGCIFRGALS